MWNRVINGRKVKSMNTKLKESDLRIGTDLSNFSYLYLINITGGLHVGFITIILTVDRIVVSNLERGLVELLDKSAIYLSFY